MIVTFIFTTLGLLCVGLAVHLERDSGLIIILCALAALFLILAFLSTGGL